MLRFNLSDPDVEQTEWTCVNAVNQSAWQLLYVRNQTENICMEAVKENGLALQYVNNQTEAICIEAVKKDGYALQYVKNQTEAVCLCAVKKDGYALQFVHHQTNEMCIEAIFQCLGSLMFVKNQTDAICLIALAIHTDDRRHMCFRYIYHMIKYPSPQLVNQLLKIYPSHTNIIMTTYVTNLMKYYKWCHGAITKITQHTCDLLYKPNSVKALAGYTRWHTVISSKTLFLTKS